MEWHAYVDGASAGNPGESGAGIVIYDENGCELHREGIYLGRMTNNMAEYEALLLALKRTRESSVRNLYVYTDSLLVANQLSGKYKINSTELLKYVTSARAMLSYFDKFVIKHIPREMNRIADKLAKEAVDKKGVDG